MRRIQLVLTSCLLLVVASCQQNDSITDQVVDGGTQDSSITSDEASRVEVRPDLAETNDGNNTALAVFEKRILPIFQAQKPSSCTECHLSGVDLKDYIQPSQEKTFASLVSVGLVDVQKPDDSKILQFIARRPEQPNLITDKVRQQELEAFEAWIRAAVEDPALLAAKTTESIGPQVPDEVRANCGSTRSV